MLIKLCNFGPFQFFPISFAFTDICLEKKNFFALARGKLKNTVGMVKN